MPNLRLIYDNVASSATLTASTTAGTLAASNMLTDVKSVVHRSTGTSVTYTMTWTANQTVGGVALPATNLTSTATIRSPSKLPFRKLMFGPAWRLTMN